EPTDFDHVVPELNLPSSHLYLREFGGESLVLAKERLKAGTVLGTYKGHLQQSDTEDTNGLLKVNRSDGGSPIHVMLEDEGHWLKLMRTANLPTEANICLRISECNVMYNAQNAMLYGVGLRGLGGRATKCGYPGGTASTRMRSRQISKQILASPGDMAILEVELPTTGGGMYFLRVGSVMTIRTPASVLELLQRMSFRGS
ncbi:hypothetical protein AVEN_130795-1, partial [Araneus ventricosus]